MRAWIGRLCVWRVLAWMTMRMRDCGLDYMLSSPLLVGGEPDGLLDLLLQCLDQPLPALPHHLSIRHAHPTPTSSFLPRKREKDIYIPLLRSPPIPQIQQPTSRSTATSNQQSYHQRPSLPPSLCISLNPSPPYKVRRISNPTLMRLP